MNNGLITAQDVYLEAQRDSRASIVNAGTIRSDTSITLVTGLPGAAAPTGPPSAGTFGVENTGGVMVAATITVRPYYPASSGGKPIDGIFDTKDPALRAQLEGDFKGGRIFGPTGDNTPTSAAAPVTNSANTFTTTSSIVIPQLAPSMTHLNATSQALKPTLVATNGAAEQVRGADAQPTISKPKPRVKAKPVLLRGAFFGSKINASITANP